ncbi:MAG: 8-oxo-dGTP diphosphatase [Planctomycetota bacterium]|jgi:8-oxo-dGTP diphosphatase
MKQQQEQPSPEDAAFIATYDATAFERPSVAVDVVLMTLRKGRLCALLVERIEPPERGAWALPGGFVGMEESLDEAAQRVLQQKAGLSDVFVEQLFTFGAPSRDPRTRVISVTYYALVELSKIESVIGKGNGRQLLDLEVDWEGEKGGPAIVKGVGGEELTIAFDHAAILGLVIKRLRGKLDYAPIGFEMLPARFTLRQLQSVHEAVLGHSLNKDSFRRRMLASDRLLATGEREQDVIHRPAELYRYLSESR